MVDTWVPAVIVMLKCIPFLVFVITPMQYTPDICEIKTQQPANSSPYTICLPPPRTSYTDRVCVPHPCGRTDRVCVCVTRGVIVQAHPTPFLRLALPTQHSTTRRKRGTHTHTCTRTHIHTSISSTHICTWKCHTRVSTSATVCTCPHKR